MLNETENRNVLQGSTELEEEKTMMAVLREMNSVMSQVEENLNQLENKISSLELENEELNGKLKVTVEENETLKKDKEELESSHGDLKKKLEIELQQKIQLEEIMNQLSSKMLSLESEKDCLDKQLQVADSKIVSMESEKMYWDKKLKVAKEDNESLKKDREDFESLCKDLKKKLDIEIQQKIQLEGTLNQLNSSIVSLESDKTDLDGKLKLIEEENVSVKLAKEELESVNEDLKKKVEEEMQQQKIQFDGNMNQLDSKVISLESEKNDLDQKLKLLEEDNESLKKDKEKIESLYEDLKKKLEEEIQQKSELEEKLNEINRKKSERTETDSPMKQNQNGNKFIKKDEEEIESVEEDVEERIKMETQEESQTGNMSEEPKSKEYPKSLAVTSPVVTQKQKEIKKLQSELVKEKEYFAKMVQEKSKENSDYQMQLNDENQKRVEVEQELNKSKKEVEMLKEQLSLAHGIIYSNSLTSVGGSESMDEDHLEATLSMPAGKNIKRSGWDKHTVEVTPEKIIFYETENEKASNKRMLEIDLDKLFDVQAVTQEDVIRAKAKHIPKIFQLLYTDETEAEDKVDQQLNNSQSEKLKDKDVINYNNHEFVVMHFHMPTSCGSCNKTLSSVIRPRPALYCKLCHLKVHKDHHDKNEEFCPPCKVSTGEGSTKNLLLMANSPKEKQKWIDYLNKKIILHKKLDAESSNISSSEIE